MKTLLIFPLILLSFIASAQVNRYNIISRATGDTLTLQVVTESEFSSRQPEYTPQQTYIPTYYINFEVWRPVRNGLVIDGYYVKGVDPEKTTVSHYGSGTRYFTTNRYKGGVIVKDARYINSHSARQYMLTIKAYDATQLFMIAYCYINVH